MHELSIALAIVDFAAEEAERRGRARVVAVHLRLGPLSGVVKEALLGAYELASEASAVAGSRLVIEDVPILAWCPACRADQPVVSIQCLCCRECGTPSAQVVSGRDLEVTAMEIADEPSDPREHAREHAPADPTGRSAAEGAQAE